ncbi:disulfide bond formation protein B [Pseudomonas capeferrum]|uniref:disulfide bond formation protein B n=1 Tax=Pseudomonas capeferrum TaxID=1495066 RepID=UPI0015E47A79|nr:disulfide bond formation protein B [Pseudomonas capeferrum]MBA1202212.1 disulfide bond formation protein B [Pseudomonas capeferrum]
MSLARMHSLFLPAFLVSLAILGVSLYLENIGHLLPCPQCYSQRALLGAFSLVCLCALMHRPGPTGTRLYAGLTLLCALCGAALAARHVWLQGAAMKTLGCVPAPAVETGTSLMQSFKMLVLGNQICTSLTWSFLDLTLPEWSLLAFLLLSTLPLYYLLPSFQRTFPRIVRD